MRLVRGTTMLNTPDLYTWTDSVSIFDQSSKKVIGTLIVEYTARLYTDVRNLTSTRAYHITCTQRVIFPNANISKFGPGDITGFLKYPAMMTATVNLNAGSNGGSFYVVDYKPKTMNTAVMTSQSGALNSQTTSSLQHTTGSSTSETNSYEVGVSLGIFGDSPTGGFSTMEGHSETTSEDQAFSTGQAVGRGTQSASSNSMSIKDWAAYAALDAKNAMLSWVWGQEYPWNVIEFHNTHQKSPDSVKLPEYVKDLLWDSGKSGSSPQQIYPPSKLSLFGINFLMKCSWLYPVSDQTPIDTVSFTHALTYYQGSHEITTVTPADLSVTLAQVALAYGSSSSTSPYKSAQIDLGKLALEPVRKDASGHRAIVGFVPTQFVVQPPGISPEVNAAPIFSIKSGANNLYIRGSGFAAPSGEDVPMSADLTTGDAQLEVDFKIVDVNRDYTLFLKHWKTGAAPCLMQIWINQSPTSAPVVSRHIDSLEAGSGTNNVSTIILRRKSYNTAEYYDYLTLGLNTIIIKLSPSQDGASGASCGYAIRALAIG